MKRAFAKMQPCISVLTHISSDVTQPSLYLTAKNGQKYLIGRVSEGFQRTIGEQKVKTSKLSGVFLSGRHHWNACSGLPGMLLSFGDRDLDIKKVYTGPGTPFARVSQMIKSWDNFTFHQPLSVHPDCSIYSDENLEIRPLTIDSDSTSYVIQMKPIRGKFLVAKAKALGVPSGKLFGQLSEGFSVNVPGTNTFVHPHEVMGPSPVPARVLVLDLPTMSHVRAAQDPTTLACLLAQYPDSGFDLQAVYFFFSHEVDLDSPEVLSLRRCLCENDTRHLVSHPFVSPDFNTLNTVTNFQATFMEEFPAHFSLLYSQPAQGSLPKTFTQPNYKNNVVRILEQQHVLSIAPRLRDEPETKKTKRFKAELEIQPPTLKNPGSIRGIPYVPCSELREPEIVTLGTGASAPSKYRNVSSTLVRTRLGAVLFDCGEATSNSITRIFGPDGRSGLLRDLRVLYISHMHADHHLGAQQVLRYWLSEAKICKELPKLIVAAPPQFHAFIKQWSQIDEYESQLDSHVHFLDLDSVCIGKRYSSALQIGNEAIDAETNSSGIKIITCTAIHCNYSYNGCITFPKTAETAEFKVSYSGDSRPNKFFAQHVGLDSDLLIHEATHEDELAEEAIKKRHSTISEALEIARSMRANNTILTHISQRYPRLPTIGESNSQMVGPNQHACFAFDAMHTKLSEIQNIQQMVPRMGELFGSLITSGAEDNIED